MNIRRPLAGMAALTLTLALSIGTSASADEIYKWTDEDGNVHYEDRPSGAATEERLQFSYNRTSSTAVQKRVQSQRDLTNARRISKEEAAEEERTSAGTRAAAEERVAKCQSYRASMKSMLEAPRVYREDQDGERQYLDDTARAEARSKAEELIKETCGD